MSADSENKPKNEPKPEDLAPVPEDLAPVLYEVRCAACGALLFVSRANWRQVAVADAEIVILCKQRRGGFKCRTLAPLCREAA